MRCHNVTNPDFFMKYYVINHVVTWGIKPYPFIKDNVINSDPYNCKQKWCLKMKLHIVIINRNHRPLWPRHQDISSLLCISISYEQSQNDVYGQFHFWVCVIFLPDWTFHWSLWHCQSISVPSHTTMAIWIYVFTSSISSFVCKYAVSVTATHSIWQTPSIMSLYMRILQIDLFYIVM